MNFKQDFAGDLEQILANIRPGNHFGFARFNTGEAGILQNRVTHARGSGWVFDPKRNREYHRALTTAYSCSADNWYAAISCPCCNPVEYRWYEQHPHLPMSRITFATIFMGANWPRTRQWLKDNRGKYVLVSPKHGDFDVPANTFEPDWDWTRLLHNLIGLNGEPILFACGPVGKILAYSLLNIVGGPLVDIGSAYDLEIWGKPTRLYLKKPSRKKLKSKASRKENNRIKRLYMRRCKWALAKKAVHK